MSKLKDLTGQVFGKLTVIKYVDKGKWLCKCSCGNETTVTSKHLKNNHTKSCGCLRTGTKGKNTRTYTFKKDLTGQTFGKLTVIKYVDKGKWLCKCSCGNETIAETRALNSGHKKSCGCANYDSKNAKDMTNYEDNNFKVIERSTETGNGIAKWKCICKHCGRIFITNGCSIRLHNIESCGCKHSKNEQKIIKLLLNSNVEFAKEYTFDDLYGIGGRKLRFDFAIFDKNHKLHHLIEFNGLQHYERPKGNWNLDYVALLKNDEIKKNYCYNNNIELRIIKYDQDYSLKDLI